MSRARSRREKLLVRARQLGVSPGWHFEDLEPQPKKQPKLVVKPDAVYEAEMERDMAAVWQTHEATSTWSTYRALWPNSRTFRSNWPQLATDLIVADWKVSRAEKTGAPIRTLEDGTVVIEEIDIEILDPPPAPEREPWQVRYADELAEHPSIGWAMQQSLDAVFSRAKLTPTSRAALRLWLEGESDAAIAQFIHRRPRFVPEIRRKALQAVIDAFRLSGNLIASESNPFVHVGEEASCSQLTTSTPSSARLSSGKLAV